MKMKLLLWVCMLICLSSLAFADGEILASDTGDISVNGTPTSDGLSLLSAGYTLNVGSISFLYNSSATYDGDRGIYSLDVSAVTSVRPTTPVAVIPEGTLVYRIKCNGGQTPSNQIWVGPSGTGTFGATTGIGFGIYTDATYFSGYDYKADSSFASTLPLDTNWHKIFITWNSTTLSIYEGNFTNKIHSNANDYSGYITTYNLQLDDVNYPV